VGWIGGFSRWVGVEALAGGLEWRL